MPKVHVPGDGVRSLCQLYKDGAPLFERFCSHSRLWIVNEQTLYAGTVSVAGLNLFPKYVNTMAWSFLWQVALGLPDLGRSCTSPVNLKRLTSSCTMFRLQLKVLLTSTAEAPACNTLIARFLLLFPNTAQNDHQNFYGPSSIHPSIHPTFNFFYFYGSSHIRTVNSRLLLHSIKGVPLLRGHHWACTCEN